VVVEKLGVLVRHSMESLTLSEYELGNSLIVHIYAQLEKMHSGLLIPFLLESSRII
jgi:hypothetical protein